MIAAAPCPLCGAAITIHEDCEDSVGADLAGFYAAHPLWRKYPETYRCALYGIVYGLPKHDDADAAATGWNLTAEAAAAWSAAGHPDGTVGSLEHDLKRSDERIRNMEATPLTNDAADVMASLANVDPIVITIDLSDADASHPSSGPIPGRGGTTLESVADILQRASRLP